MGSTYLINHHSERKNYKCAQEATYNTLVYKNYMK